jgi:hypothetical protein
MEKIFISWNIALSIAYHYSSTAFELTSVIQRPFSPIKHIGIS